MRIILAVILLIFSLSAQGGNVFFDFKTVVHGSPYQAELKLQPTNAPAIASGSMVLVNSYSARTDTNGQCTVSNLAPLTYDAFVTTKDGYTTRFRINFTNILSDTSTVNFTNLIVVSTNVSAGIAAYSTTAADAQFYPRTSNPSNYVGTNLVTLKANNGSDFASASATLANLGGVGYSNVSVGSPLVVAIRSNIQSTASGGTVRGTNSTDLQVARTASTNVASAPNSTISGGIDNSISHENPGSAIVGGSGNHIYGDANPGSGHMVVGGSGNRVNTSENGFAFGNNNTVDSAHSSSVAGEDSYVAGAGAFAFGTLNTNKGSYASISGGYLNTLSADMSDFATIGGGMQNQAGSTFDGGFSIIPGGQFNLVDRTGGGAYGSFITNNTEDYAQMIGYVNKAMTVHSNGNVNVVGTFSVSGTASVSALVSTNNVRGATVTATGNAIIGGTLTNGNQTTTGTIVSYNGETTTGSGVMPIVARFTRTGQTTAMTVQTMYTTTATGEYHIEPYWQCTTAGSGGTMSITVGWTDENGVQAAALNGNFSLSATSSSGLTTARTIHCLTGTAITMTVTFNAVSGNPQWALFVNILRL